MGFSKMNVQKILSWESNIYFRDCKSLMAKEKLSNMPATPLALLSLHSLSKYFLNPAMVRPQH